MKKGFSLVEIIISISLILVIGMCAFIGFNVIQKNNKIKTLESMNDQILSAANLYIETNTEIKDKLFTSANGLKIPLTTLENAGLVDFQKLDIDEVNSLGNFFENIGQFMLAKAAQDQVISNRNNNNSNNPIINN